MKKREKKNERRTKFLIVTNFILQYIVRRLYKENGINLK